MDVVAKSGMDRNKAVWVKVKKMKMFYIMLLVPLVFILVFHYFPMYGIIIAFQDFKIGYGISGSKFVYFDNFIKIFSNPDFFRILKNTVVINCLNTVFGFPMPIIFAILINEITKERFKKIVQSISYLPYFLSWVILASMVTEVLSPQRGIINYILSQFGVQPIYFLAESAWFRPVIVITGIWQGAGWGSIVYLATITTIDPCIYESAEIDGARRFRKIWYITIPSLMPIITYFFLFQISAMLKTNFDQIFNLLNPATYSVGDVIDTYIYRVGILGGGYDFTTAIGLFINVVGVMLLIIANSITKKFSDYTLW